MADIDKSIKSLEQDNPDLHKEAILMLGSQKEGMTDEKKVEIE